MKTENPTALDASDALWQTQELVRVLMAALAHDDDESPDSLYVGYEVLLNTILEKLKSPMLYCDRASRQEQKKLTE